MEKEEKPLKVTDEYQPVKIKIFLFALLIVVLFCVEVLRLLAQIVQNTAQ